MTLTTQQTACLTRLIGLNREDWDSAGILAQLEKLAVDTRPWNVLQAQAVYRSGDLSQRTPRCLLESWPTKTEAVVRQLRPRDADYPCLIHGGRIRDDNGDYACCKQTDGDLSPAPFVRRPCADYSPETTEKRRDLAFGSSRRSLALKQED